jgi:hypothetical protein
LALSDWRRVTAKADLRRRIPQTGLAHLTGEASRIFLT